MYRFFCAILVTLALLRGQVKADENDTRARLHALGAAVKAYRLVHNDSAPESLAALYHKGLVHDLATFVLPGTNARVPTRLEIDALSAFTLAPLPNAPNLLVRERVPHHHAGKVLALFPNGIIRLVPVSDAGSAAAGGAGLTGPPGLSLSPGLRVARWVSIRRIADFGGGKVGEIYNLKLSGDGSKILFGAQRGVYYLNVDGSGLTQLSDKGGTTLLDLSHDGFTAAWYNQQDGVVVARLRDGVTRQTMPGQWAVNLGLRLTADGKQLFIACSDRGEIQRFSTDGSSSECLVTTRAIKDLLMREKASDAGYWSPGLDIARDGSRMVFRYVPDAFSWEANGRLRRVTRSTPARGQVERVCLSGDGRFIAHLNHYGTLPTSLTIVDWGNLTPCVVHNTNLVGYHALQFAGDHVLVNLGLRLFASTANRQLDLTGEVLGASLLQNTRLATSTADGRRCCLVAGGGLDQLVLVEFNGATGRVPELGRVHLAANWLTAKVSLTVTVQPGEQKLQKIGVVPVRGGEPIGWRIIGNALLNDDGREGDATAKDGIFTGVIGIGADAKVDEGPLSLRFLLSASDGVALIVDVEGVEVRRP